MHLMATVAFKIGEMRWLMWVGIVPTCLRIGHAEVCRSPGDLVITAMLMALEAAIHAIAFAHERLLVVLAQIANGLDKLLIQVELVAVDTADTACRMDPNQQVGVMLRLDIRSKDMAARAAAGLRVANSEVPEVSPDDRRPHDDDHHHEHYENPHKLKETT